MQQINVSGNSWSPIAGNVLPVCVPTYDSPCNLLTNNLELTHRIGSDSADAIVFGLEIDRCKMAVKLMFDIDDKSNSKNENEVAIAKFVSEAVRRKMTDRFPVVYGGTLCDNIIIPSSPNSLNDLNLVKSAKKYAVGKYIKTKYGKAGKLFYYRNRNLGLIDFIKAAKDTFGDSSVDNIPISGYILISEMVWGDLIQLLDKTPRDEVDGVFDIIIPEIFLAIYDLHMLGISHNDLHFGNLMLRIDDGGHFRVIIHDFGHSEVIGIGNDRWTDEQILFDIGKMADSIRTMDKFNNTQVREKMEKVIQYINGITMRGNNGNEKISNNIYLKLADMW